MDSIVYHTSSNLTFLRSHFSSSSVPNLMKSLPSNQLNLPLQATIMQMKSYLQKSSCAVVGASASLKTCESRNEICKHDVVIHVNDHPQLLRICPRIDIQVVNQFACKWNMNSNQMETSGKKCTINPTLFRLRTEWTSQSQFILSKNSWLSTGYISTKSAQNLHDFGGRCCATTGGNAIVFALHTCKTVSLYGLGGNNKTYIDDSTRKFQMSVHNTITEHEWIKSLSYKKLAHVPCL